MKRKLHFLLAVSIGLTTSVGWLHAEGINSLTTLKAAIDGAKAGETIALTGDIEDANAESGSAITISKSLTLDGKGFTISGTALQNIMVVDGTSGTVELKDLTLKNDRKDATPADGKGYNDLTVYQRGTDAGLLVTLNNVRLLGNGGIGLVNNSSNVNATGLVVGNHVWGSVNLENKKENTTPVFTLDKTSQLNDPLQVWADYKEKEDWFNVEGWKGYHYFYKIEDSKYVWKKTAWTSKYDSETKTVKVNSAIEFQNLLAGMVNDATAHSEGLVKTISIEKDLDINDLVIAQSSIGAFHGIINVRQPVVIEGNGHTITGSFKAKEGESYYLLKFDGNSAGSTVQNLTIDGVNATALDLITGTTENRDSTIYITNVNLFNNAGGGLNVNATKVVATDLHTKGNSHGVRITVDSSRGKGYANPHFTLTGNSLLEETIKIAYNAKENPNTYNPNSVLARSIEQRLSFVSIETKEKADWKTTWQMAKLSSGFKVANAVLTWTNELNETALAGKKLANMTDVSELDSLFTYGGATVDGIVWTATDKQELTTDITLDRSFAVIGSGKAKCVVNGNWTIAPSDTTDIILTNLTLTEVENTTTAVVTPMIDITKSKTNLSLTDVDIIPVAPGTSDKREAISLKEVTSSTIALLRVNINLTKGNQIGFYNKKGFCNFSMTDSKIASNENVNSLSGLRCILTEGADNSTYTINGSELSVGDNYHYSIWIKSPKQHFVINDSKVYGWGAFYMQGAHREGGADYMTLEASNTTFTGVGKAGETNGFGVIVFEATDYSTVKLTDCTIQNKPAAGIPEAIGGFIAPFVFQIGGAGETTWTSVKPSTHCSVEMIRCTVNNMDEMRTPVMVDYNNIADPNGFMDRYNNKISADSNTKILKADGSNSFLVLRDDTIRNAAMSLPRALIRPYKKSVVSKGEIDVVAPVAYPGDSIVATSIKVTAALTTLNLKDTVPTTYTIPDSIIIECKDAFLVTGESAAKAFAATVGSNKPVFYLKRDDDKLFTTTSVGNTCVKINSNTIWYNAINANRSVEIADGATLTINVAMSLDTVFMAEGAQLVANAAVTANAVQLTYGTTKVWKAFGFPFAIGSVKNVAGDKEIKTTASAKDGVWTAGIDDKEPKFTVTGENATPAAACIIASEKDSSIVVTSTGSTLSLATKAEPNAPVVTPAAAPASLKSGETVNFKIYSNPNLSDMTLTQTAYVLSDDGKTFDRMVNPTIKAFQSFVLADEATTSTLRSLRIGDTPTGNEIVPVEGYFVETGHGTITIHTAEPTQVIVVDMLGRVHYNARVNDGAQIAVPAGIYAVNRQKVIVK